MPQHLQLQMFCVPELNVMLLELMLEFHAWSTARPAHESDTAADTLEKEVKVVIELEKEQGTSSLIGRPVFPTLSRDPP